MSPVGIYERTPRQLLNQRLSHLGKQFTPEHKQRIAESCKKHGGYKTKLYAIWGAIKQRCLNPNNRGFHRYGGRGITLYSEWYNFVSFRNWALSHGYQEGLSIDRIDNDGNYYPDNCQWITIGDNSRKDYKNPWRKS